MFCKEACEYPGPALKIIGETTVNLSFFDEMITRASGGEQEQAYGGTAIEGKRCEKLFVQRRRLEFGQEGSYEETIIEFQLMKGWRL